MGVFGIIEIKDSRVYNFAAADETTLTAVYLAYWEPTTAGEQYPGDGQVLAQTGMPMVNTRPPAAITSPTGTLQTYMANFVCRSVTVTPETAVPYTFRVEAQYFHINPSEDKKQGYGTKQTRQITGRSYAEYRTGVTLPASGTAAWPPTLDIGGTKRDLNGNPRVKELPQVSYQVEYKWDRSPLISTTAPFDPPFQTWFSAINKRNSVAFLDADIGTMLYKGASATLDREIWRIVHTWIFDSYYHLEQMPTPNPTGLPILMPGVSISGQQINQCNSIAWYQRYPDTTDFNASFLDPTTMSDLTKAYPPKLY